MPASLPLSVRLFVDDAGRVHLTSDDSKLAESVHLSPRPGSAAETTLRDAFAQARGVTPKVIRRAGLTWHDVASDNAPHVAVFGSFAGVTSAITSISESFVGDDEERWLKRVRNLDELRDLFIDLERSYRTLAAEGKRRAEKVDRLVIVEFDDRTGNFMSLLRTLLREGRAAGWSVLVVGWSTSGLELRDAERELAGTRMVTALVNGEIDHDAATMLRLPTTTLDLPVRESDRWAYRTDDGTIVLSW